MAKISFMRQKKRLAIATRIMPPGCWLMPFASGKEWKSNNERPDTNIFLYIIKKAYDRFAERAGNVASAKGEKSKLVLQAIKKQAAEFRLVDIERECPGVGRDWIRVILFGLKEKGKVTYSGKGKGVRWWVYR